MIIVKLRLAAREAPSGSVDRKLAAIRAADRHDFPTADIDQMLRETGIRRLPA